MNWKTLNDYLRAGKPRRVNFNGDTFWSRGWTRRPNVLRIYQQEILVDTDNTPMPMQVRYHDTIIATFFHNGDVMLNSGGFRTVTTKRWLEEFGVRVWSEKCVWYVRTPFSTVPFADGMIIKADGTVDGEASREELAEEKARRKKIKLYAKQFAKKFFDGKVEAPSGGDCWFCHMIDSVTKKPLGETNKDTSHLVGHMERKYYVPSLMLRAVTVSNKASNMLKSVINMQWQGEEHHAGGRMRDVLEKQLETCIRDYLFTQFNITRG